jgi:hypothetical protein
MLNKDAEMRIRDYLASPFWGIDGMIRLLNELWEWDKDGNIVRKTEYKDGKPVQEAECNSGTEIVK